ncbi:hypothetical protein FOPG_20120 [Fusarium oxysporum f. sp. conglutinans race 2 54008]|uniref:Uncharacterized protein n=1 Tax=Fusarium oxysporum f. sp. conglutinans race 2 54008 TaxID=1089457 RepID=X0GUS7_FUSOX|nr:hypothetical protein FOPG_20120 [Fusarium oxysporum f. sp. conglutinans race 2 54008]
MDLQRTRIMLGSGNQRTTLRATPSTQRSISTG